MFFERFGVLKEIDRLDAERDHQRIVWLTTAFDFPWDTQRALELALMRTFAVPSSAALMVETGEFVERTQKRYDDTTIIISTIGSKGYDSPAGRAAIRRMNQIHRRYSIPNDEYLYVLSTFVFEPFRWNARYGWRKLSRKEKLASFYFWREVGKRMAITGIPETLEGFERFNREYERMHFAYSDHNRALAVATRDLFLAWMFPKPLRPLGAELLYPLMDDAMREAFGFPKPRTWARLTVEGGLWLRKKLLKVLPPRSRPYELPPPRSYPEGYQLEYLGPQGRVEGR